MASGHGVNKPRTEFTHQTRRNVSRERFTGNSRTYLGRNGLGFSVGVAPSRPGLSMWADEEGGITDMSLGGPAGSVRRRGPRFTGED